MNIIMRIGRTEVLYFLMMCIAIGLTFVRNISFGIYLEPKLMGYYSIALTVASYGVFLQLGIMNGLARELPISFGKKEIIRTPNLVGVSTSSILLIQLIGFGVYTVIIFITGFEEDQVQIAFLLGGLLALSIPFRELVMLRLRAEQKILSFSLLQLFNAGGVLVFGVLAIKYYGFVGAIWTIIALNIISFYVVSKKYLCKVNYKYYNTKEVRYLIKIGFPIMVAGVLKNLQMSMDRLFLIKDSSAVELGVYQIGLMPLTFAIVLNGIVSQYITPKMLYKYGQGKSLEYLFKQSFLVSISIVLGMLVFLPLVPYISSHIINNWLPAYKDSLPVIIVFYIGAIFTSANIIGLIINAANRQILYFYQSIFMVSIGFMGYLYVSYYEMGILWYAYINTGAQIVNFLTIFVVAYFVVKTSNTQKLI